MQMGLVYIYLRIIDKLFISRYYIHICTYVSLEVSLLIFSGYTKVKYKYYDIRYM